jgi:hypothetical protein
VVKYKSKYNYSNMGNTLATLSAAAVLSVGNAQAEGFKSPDFSGLMESHNPAVEQVISNTQARMAPLAENVLLAQASQETDGKIYIVYVIQVDGSKKEVRYTKDTTGIIIPPESWEEGKLLDGSPASSNPKLNIGKNRSILAKYDKDTQILASINMEWVINEADGYIKKFIALSKEWKIITQEDLFNALYGIYVFKRLWWDENSNQLKGVITVAQVKMKMTEQQISLIREQAEKKAKVVLPVITRAVG